MNTAANSKNGIRHIIVAALMVLLASFLLVLPDLADARGGRGGGGGGRGGGGVRRGGGGGPPSCGARRTWRTAGVGAVGGAADAAVEGGVEELAVAAWLAARSAAEAGA